MNSVAIWEKILSSQNLGEQIVQKLEILFAYLGICFFLFVYGFLLFLEA